MKQLDRLLFEQGGDCFFCKQPLAKEDASVEHLLAQANGGTSAEENVVACCKAVNSLFGNKPLKDKFAIVLRQKGGFQCPAKLSTSLGSSTTQAAKPAATRPPASPKPGPAAKKAPALAAVSSVGILALANASPAVTCPTCRRTVPAAVGQVDYV